MKPVKVVLVSLRGPAGQIDVAIRADVALIDVLPAISNAIGLPLGSTTATLERAHTAASCILGRQPRDSETLSRRFEACGSAVGGHFCRAADIPVRVSLADAGLLDGDAVILRTSRRKAPTATIPWPLGRAAHPSSSPS